MDAETLRELRTLRARAYGPSADIEQDPSALRRLHELEGIGGDPGHAEPTADLPHEPESPRDALPLVTARTEPPAPVESTRVTLAPPPEPVGAPPSRKGARTGLGGGGRRSSLKALPRGIRVLWLFSVVAAGALAAGITYALVSVSPIITESGARQIATLEPSTMVLPAGWMGAGPSALVFEFYGLTIFESAGGYGVTGSECITAVATELLPEPDVSTNAWSVNGNMYTGCRVGSFPATVQMVVDSGAPKDLRAKFPARSALQFVLDGDRLGVFLASG